MKRVSLLLLALAATFALHAQGVKDPDNNKASRGETLVFTGTTYDPGFNEWYDENNWHIGTPDGALAGRLPNSGDDVVIASGAICNMPDDAVGQYASLTIEDGGQFYAPEDAEIIATVKKNIARYGAFDGWYLLSFPTDLDQPDFVGAGMITSSAYDLFFFDQDGAGEVEEEDPDPDAGEWRNYKYYIENGLEFKAPIDSENDRCYNGYLYANSRNTSLSFTGTLFTESEMTYKRLHWNNSAEQVGVNLIGNPYTCNAEMVAGNKISGYYMLNEERNDVIVYDDGDFDYTYVAPMTAFFAVASANKP